VIDRVGFAVRLDVVVTSRAERVQDGAVTTPNDADEVVAARAERHRADAAA
jgi:hypothetical protein